MKPMKASSRAATRAKGTSSSSGMPTIEIQRMTITRIRTGRKRIWVTRPTRPDFQGSAFTLRSIRSTGRRATR